MEALHNSILAKFIDNDGPTYTESTVEKHQEKNLLVYMHELKSPTRVVQKS